MPEEAAGLSTTTERPVSPTAGGRVYLFIFLKLLAFGLAANSVFFFHGHINLVIIFGSLYNNNFERPLG